MLCGLAACSSHRANTTPAAGAPPNTATTAATSTAVTAKDRDRFTSERWGFTLDHPADWRLRPDFSKSYLQSGTWKTYAGRDTRGTPVAALAMPHSNHVTDAEIRIGASKAPQAIRQCGKPPQAVRAGSVGDVSINGVHFTRFEAGDAAMSHYLEVHAYRTVHDGACYAIDLLVYGTNPEVYDPPAQAPFSHQQAFAAMRGILESFRFTRP